MTSGQVRQHYQHLTELVRGWIVDLTEARRSLNLCGQRLDVLFEHGCHAGWLPVGFSLMYWVCVIYIMCTWWVLHVICFAFYLQTIFLCIIPFFLHYAVLISEKIYLKKLLHQILRYFYYEICFTIIVPQKKIS